MFDYDRLILRWGQDPRFKHANGLLHTLIRLDIYDGEQDQRPINGTYFEKEWMAHLCWTANEFIDTVSRMGLTPDGRGRPELRDYYWDSLNPF